MALLPTTKAKQSGGIVPPSKLYICGKLAKSSFSALTFKQKVLVKALFCYNQLMDYVAEYVNMIYATLTGLVPLIVPILVIYLLFRIIAKFIVGENR